MPVAPRHMVENDSECKHFDDTAKRAKFEDVEAGRDENDDTAPQQQLSAIVVGPDPSMSEKPWPQCYKFLASVQRWSLHMKTLKWVLTVCEPRLRCLLVTAVDWKVVSQLIFIASGLPSNTPLRHIGVCCNRDLTMLVHNLYHERGQPLRVISLEPAEVNAVAVTEGWLDEWLDAPLVEAEQLAPGADDFALGVVEPAPSVDDVKLTGSAVGVMDAPESSALIVQGTPVSNIAELFLESVREVSTDGSLPKVLSEASKEEIDKFLCMLSNLPTGELHFHAFDAELETWGSNNYG